MYIISQCIYYTAPKPISTMLTIKPTPPHLTPPLLSPTARYTSRIDIPSDHNNRKMKAWTQSPYADTRLTNQVANLMDMQIMQVRLTIEGPRFSPTKSPPNLSILCSTLFPFIFLASLTHSPHPLTHPPIFSYLSPCRMWRSRRQLRATWSARHSYRLALQSWDLTGSGSVQWCPRWIPASWSTGSIEGLSSSPLAAKL